MTTDLLKMLEFYIKVSDKENAYKFIKANKDLDYQSYRNEYGETLIHLSLLPSNDMVALASELIDKFDKTNLEHRDNDNKSIFEMAIFDPALVRKLLVKGLNPDIRDADGYKLISRAAEIDKLSVVKIFHEEYGVDLNDDLADSALTLASSEEVSHIVEYLIKANVDLTDFFIKYSARKYIPILQNDYKRLGEYVEEFLKYPDLEVLIPQTITDVFLF